MTARAKALLLEALRLPLEDRADVAAELIASMDGEPDADVEAAWAAELERRARRARDGLSRGTNWSVVKARIEERLERE